MVDITTLQPCAQWTRDCGGKQDYDGRLVSISTRYWPCGWGFHILTENHEWQGSEARPWVRSSAKADIVLNYGEPDEYGYGDSIELASAEFEEETEEEVKAAVEVWVRKQFQEIAELLVAHFLGETDASKAS